MEPPGPKGCLAGPNLGVEGNALAGCGSTVELGASWLDLCRGACGDVSRWLWPRYLLAGLEEHRLVLQEWIPGRCSPQAPWVVDLPEGVIAQGRPLEVAALGDFLGDLLAEQRLTGAHVLAVLPPAVSRMYRSKEQPLAGAVGSDPLEPAPKVHWQVWPLWPSASSQLCVGTDEQALRGWIDVLTRADMTLDRLVPACLCWMRQLQPDLAASPTDELIGLLHGHGPMLQFLVWRDLVPVAHWWIRLDQGSPWQHVEAHLQGLIADQGSSRLSLWTDLADDLTPELCWRSLPVLGRLGVSGFGSYALAGLVQPDLTGTQPHR